jgi:hypothetical protein
VRGFLFLGRAGDFIMQKALVLDVQAIRRSLTRISHQIIFGGI